MDELDHPAYERSRAISPLVSVVLQRNPGMMTLDGTNSWVLRAPDADGCVIVDPGEDDREHLRVLAGCEPVELILITHGHHDHVGAATSFAGMVDAPARALDPALCHDGEPLVDGDTILAGGLRIDVRHTPGHTDDSVSFVLDHDGHAAVLTGDTVLGQGTTVLSDLGDYLDSLRLLEKLLDAMPASTVGLPGHGPELRQPLATVREYLAHREQRLDQVRAALRVLGEDADVRAVVEHVYADVDPALWAPAEVSVRAQLEYLAKRGDPR